MDDFPEEIKGTAGGTSSEKNVINWHQDGISHQSSDNLRQPLGPQLYSSSSSDEDSETADSDDSFSSDDYDDDVETESKSALHSQPHTGNGISSPDNVGEGLYLTSISEAGNRSFPNSSKPQVPNKPISYPRKSCVSPEKRPQMPLPAAAGNQAPLLPPRPGTKLSSPPEICKRGLVPVPNSGESQRCIPTPPNTAKPVGNALLKETECRSASYCAGDGVFLIRPSTRSSDPLTLCVQYGGRTYNINIRRRNDALYALGTEKVNEMTFKSVDELVSTYSKEPIKLQSGSHVRLLRSPAKEDHIYVRMPVPVQKKY
ncbi:uncharacterized protein LOC135205978 isoform X4 [Macrobrachium nipponense]|uniref:uncharacterized protein LOC135205978 isoform X4 n=1 Tax=Macrobrachium nipponense TaxID=159736 RepID=UPI0030C8758F